MRFFAALTPKLLAASFKEKKVPGEISNEKYQVKKNQEEVEKLLDKIAAQIKLTCPGR